MEKKISLKDFSFFLPPSVLKGDKFCKILKLIIIFNISSPHPLSPLYLVELNNASASHVKTKSRDILTSGTSIVSLASQVFFVWSQLECVYTVDQFKRRPVVAKGELIATSSENRKKFIFTFGPLPSPTPPIAPPNPKRSPSTLLPKRLYPRISFLSFFFCANKFQCFFYI